MALSTTQRPGKQSLSFIIGASSVGTLIEWYDFYLYAILAGLFATKFFPGDLKGSFLYALAVSGSASSCVPSARSCSAISAI